MVAVEANIFLPAEPLVLNDLAEEYVCTVESDTTVVCFIVTVCFSYSLLPGDSVDKFSKKHLHLV